MLKDVFNLINNWEQLKSACTQCTKCQLCQTRTNVVFGDGRFDAEVLFIGEGPGQTEDETGIPFVGRAGKLLDKFLESVGISRQEIFIANIVKCRPPKNRDPQPQEQEACIEWLRNQVALMQPKIIVCLGRISAMKLIKPDFKVTKEHGLFFEKNGVLMMGTFHPSALLRNPNNRPIAFEDFRILRDKITEICQHTELMPLD